MLAVGPVAVISLMTAAAIGRIVEPGGVSPVAAALVLAFLSGIMLLAMGVLTGYLGAAPGLVWASGVMFVALAPMLVPVAIWIYTLVFAFAALWFAHFTLSALQALRDELAAAPVPLPEPSPSNAAFELLPPP